MNHSHIIGNAVGNRGKIRNSPGPDPMACKESLEIIGGSALHTTRTQGSAREILSPRFSAKINPIVPQPWPGPAARRHDRISFWPPKGNPAVPRKRNPSSFVP